MKDMQDQQAIQNTLSRQFGIGVSVNISKEKVQVTLGPNDSQQYETFYVFREPRAGQSPITYELWREKIRLELTPIMTEFLKIKRIFAVMILPISNHVVESNYVNSSISRRAEDIRNEVGKVVSIKRSLLLGALKH